MLHTVRRASIDRPAIAEPAYSMTWPAAPAAPIRAMIASTTSLAQTPLPSRPSIAIRIVFGRRCQSDWVARTCVISVAPMPNASAPNAPCVDVWLSAHTMIVPGQLKPCSGPTTCTMPCRGSVEAEAGDAGGGAVRHQRLRHAALFRIADRREIAAGRGNVVIRRAERPMGRARSQAAAPQRLERHRGDVVDEVPVDVEQHLPVVALEDLVARPDLGEHRLRHARCALTAAP